jgi:uncharacterized membrane protein (Fun14 family)
MNIRASLREIVRSAFTELSGSKRLLLRLAVLLVVVGGGAAAWAAMQGELDTGEPGWPLTALVSGAACIAGFLAGAAFRVCLKLALLVGAGVAAVLFALCWLGWIELPGSSFGEASRGVASYVKEQSSSLKDVMTGWLPSSGLGGLGLLAGVTQRPDTDPDD